MNRFEFVKLNDKDNNFLIVMGTSDAPFELLGLIGNCLQDMCFKGTIIIDQLLHSGNTSERFIEGYFDGESFDNKSFCFKQIDRRDTLRNYACEMLKEDNELLEYSGLTERQQRLIIKGCFI